MSEDIKETKAADQLLDITVGSSRFLLNITEGTFFHIAGEKAVITPSEFTAIAKANGTGTGSSTDTPVVTPTPETPSKDAGSALKQELLTKLNDFGASKVQLDLVNVQDKFDTALSAFLSSDKTRVSNGDLPYVALEIQNVKDVNSDDVPASKIVNVVQFLAPNTDYRNDLLSKAQDLIGERQGVSRLVILPLSDKLLDESLKASVSEEVLFEYNVVTGFNKEHALASS